VTPRRQLSLYIPEDAAAPIEAVRRVLDPVQHALIPAHVTLCRDEEVAGLSASARAPSPHKPITLVFGRAVPFDGHGVLLPCIDGQVEFTHLRQRLLAPGAIRHQSPHITLAHPRNPRAPGNAIDRALTLPPEIVVTFSDLCLIEQAPNEPWRVLERHAL
jgi:hypothetical protein